MSRPKCVQQAHIQARRVGGATEGERLCSLPPAVGLVIFVKSVESTSGPPKADRQLVRSRRMDSLLVGTLLGH
jgi:hypothetical protein